ncbi:MAG: anaerobic ribonucleoside-triphosphate reductase [Bacteroidales bacterium]|nr:anaerobic ribonucleoside-triphosphate reductase [Bacteroidales bacterium]
MKVIKRNGEIQDFDFGKIEKAVNSAFVACGKGNMPEEFNQSLIHLFSMFDDDYSFKVEKLQDIIENQLMYEKFFDVAKAYILYRDKHKDLRFIKERVDYMDTYAHSGDNAATSSETDANANVAIKNVANLDGEVFKTLNRQIQRYRMKKKLKELFPEVAEQYEADLNHHIIYQHDEASSPAVKNYCEAVSLYPLVMEGTHGMDGLGASAPKNLSSFCGQFCNLAFLLSAQCKGAVAFGEFFNVFDYYCAKDFGPDYIKRIDEIASFYPRKTIGETIHQYFQQIVYGINQPAGNRSYQSPFTNISYYDSNYWHALFDDFCFPDGTKPEWERVNFLQKDFMKWFNMERTKTMLTFPVETMALLSDGKDIIDKEYKDFTAEMYAEGHSFFTYISDNPNGLASCCRLRNEIQDNVFSFTNGLTGVQTGSANVITLNLNRIIQDWAKEEELDREYVKEHFFELSAGFKQYLVNILERVYKYHTAYKTLLYETEEAGMLNASKSNYIKMNKLYSTIGENGINEAAEFVGLKCNYNKPYMEFCRLVTGTISEQNKLHSKDKRFQFNQEFVPAEGLSSKNLNWDKEDGYWIPDGRILYNSYFYLADDPETSVLDKFRLHGREFTELLDGGVGLHCNLDEHLSHEQYLKLIDFAIANGTSYFTFNVPNSECTNEQCHHIVKVPLDVCPKCGKPMRQWTRVIGFLRPVDNFDKYRHVEALHRYYAKEVK